MPWQEQGACSGRTVRQLNDNDYRGQRQGRVGTSSSRAIGQATYLLLQGSDRSMPTAEDLLARTPGWDASAVPGGVTVDGWCRGGVAGEGTEAGWKGEARFAPARCLRAAARPVGGGTLRRLGTGTQAPRIVKCRK